MVSSDAIGFVTILLGILGGAVSGAIVSVVNFVLTKKRWEKDFKLRHADIDLKTRHFNAKYGTERSIEATTSLYDKITTHKDPNDWESLQSEIKKFLQSPTGQYLPDEVRERIPMILTEAKNKIERTDILEWYKVEQERRDMELFEDYVNSAQSEQAIELRVSDIKYNASNEVQNLLTDSILRQVKSLRDEKN